MPDVGRPGCGQADGQYRFKMEEEEEKEKWVRRQKGERRQGSQAGDTGRTIYEFYNCRNSLLLEQPGCADCGFNQGYNYS